MYNDRTTREERLGKKPLNFLEVLLIAVAVIIISWFIISWFMDFWFIQTCGYYNDCYAVELIK